VYKHAQTKLAGISGEQCMKERIRKWSGKKKENERQEEEKNKAIKKIIN